MFFKNIVLAAFITAIVASIAYSAYQEVAVTPIILAAEEFEVPEVTGSETEETWSPENGLERRLFTFSADFLTAFSFSLMLISAMATQRKLTLLQGLGWGIAGYLCFFVAPALGLPPEIPGIETSSLVGRQLWWLIAVIFTAAGLWLVVFAKIPLKTVGIVILIAPHLLGAPNPETHAFANPDPVAVAQLTELWHQFILQTSIANALLWLIIGEIGAVFTRKWILSLDQHT
ncbi:CbtA family protein [methane-oxidizing endosymbiont of Gigantopelta aegis]|uniref:CbtA family protein n=1 Tax=methane-oxidizing endosymbiont of Gigantopelta aegis TaxID=2794938 RepID=UPI0018DEA142|nr:CbtA family protein [methane-oxidizing endosymbiont of Gigantopelta aegis]